MRIYTVFAFGAFVLAGFHSFVLPNRAAAADHATTRPAAPVDADTPPELAGFLRYLAENGFTLVLAERSKPYEPPIYKYLVTDVAPDAPFPCVDVTLCAANETPAEFDQRLGQTQTALLIRPTPRMALAIGGRGREGRDTKFQEPSYLEQKARVEKVINAYRTNAAAPPSSRP